jgi:hypothetical protein
MEKRIVAAALCVALLVPGMAAGQEPEGPQPRAGHAVDRRDGVMDGLGRGAVIGALAGLALAVVQMKSCHVGCDWSSTPAVLTGWSMLGAGAGALVGLAADYDAGPAWPTGRPPMSAGVGWTSTALRSRDLTGRAVAPAFSLAVRLSPHISARAEYVRIGTSFVAAPGAIPEGVLGNVVETSSRLAGRSHGVESRRIAYVFTELVGVHPPPWGRVRLELLGGLGVQREEERAYFDAHRPLPDGRTEPIPGKYYVLDFGSPAVGFVVGADLEVTLVGGLSAVPAVRYNAMGQSATLTWGVGARWRF